MTHTLILIGISIAVVVAGFAWGMCITSKRADEAMQDAVQSLRDKGAL